jgi:hypothetical protein
MDHRCHALHCEATQHHYHSNSTSLTGVPCDQDPESYVLVNGISAISVSALLALLVACGFFYKYVSIFSAIMVSIVLVLPVAGLSLCCGRNYWLAN